MALSLALAFALAFPGTVPAKAETTGGVRSAAFRDGWQDGTGRRVTAFDLTLAPGWKTYWRAPGDGGIPPVFDFEGSTNLAGVRLHWPSPSVFDLNGLRSIGYHDRLVLPMELEPKDPSLPIHLNLRATFGVCNDICVPAEAALTAVLEGAGAADGAISAALADRPLTAEEAGLTAVACDVGFIEDGLRVTASLTMPRLGADEAVVIEPDNGSIWVSEPVADRKGNVLTAVADLVASTGAPFALERSALRLTVISGARSVEVRGCPAAE